MAGYIGKSQGVVLTDIDNNSVATTDIQDGAVTAAKLDTTYATPAYVDTAEADAVSSANSYTDTAISNIDALPDQTGNSGKYLTTDGTDASWGAVDLSSYATTTELNTAVANSSNWDTAYGWGDHSTQNYVVSTGDTMTGALNFGDNVKAQFGAGNDLQIYHDGSNSYVTDAGTGNLILKGGTQVQLQASNGETALITNDNGAVSLNYDNSTKLATTNVGVTVTGNISADGFRGNDNATIELGNIGDLKIYHDGSHSYVEDQGAGYLMLMTNGTGVQIRSTGPEVMADFTKDGAASLNYNNVKKLETTSSGVSVTGSVTATNTFKAFTNFKGTGTVTNRDSFNVSSISDLGAGQYRVNFSTSINTHYCVTFVGSNLAPNLGDAGSCAIINYTDMLTTSCRVAVKNVQGSLSGNAIDVDVATVGFFTP